MRRFRSLLWRIMGLHILAIAVAAVALPLATYLLLNATTANFENRTLQAHADTIARFLSPAGNGRWSLALPPDLNTFYQHGFDGFAYAIIDAKGQVEYSSLPGHVALKRKQMRAEEQTYFNHRNGKAIYYGVSIPERRDGRLVWVEVVQDLQHPDVIFDDIAADFLKHIVWFIIPIMFVLLAADILIVRRALRPIVRASTLARTIDPTNLETRLPTVDIPSEILPLVTAVNQAIDRIEKGFRTLQEFTADAAHELRTPLSVLKLRIDTALAPEVAAPLRKDIDGMSHVVDQLLSVAELESIVITPGDRADLVYAAAEAVGILAPLAVRAGKDIALARPDYPVVVRGREPLLVQAIRNLGENALDHSPTGTCVDVVVEANGTVRVLDEGPGIRDYEKDLIFQRHWRRSRAKGKGLGLSIVNRIVEMHGGSIEVANRKPTGAIFSLGFVLAA